MSTTNVSSKRQISASIHLETLERVQLMKDPRNFLKTFHQIKSYHFRILGGSINFPIIVLTLAF